MAEYQIKDKNYPMQDPPYLSDYQVGDKVRVMQVPPYLYRDDPVDNDTALFFERCVGNVFRVEDFDKHGQLELWVTEEGFQAPNILAHTIFIEPEYVVPSM
jgi:hypothetical protein